MRTKKSNAVSKIQPTYIERADKAQKKVQVALFKQARGIWKELQAGKDKMSDAAVLIVNKASQLGGVMKQICGGDQLGFSFWRAECAKQLPFSKEIAEELIAVNKKVPEPITKISQIWPVWKQVNMALGTMQIPERTEEQNASTTSPLTSISQYFIKGYSQFESWQKSEEAAGRPIESWPKDRLEAIAVDTKQPHDLHEKAKALLAKSV
jgi:hypothetical protein